MHYFESDSFGGTKPSNAEVVRLSVGVVGAADAILAFAGVDPVTIHIKQNYS